MSQIFVVGSSDTVSTGPSATTAAITSVPQNSATGYRPGENIEIDRDVLRGGERARHPAAADPSRRRPGESRGADRKVRARIGGDNTRLPLRGDEEQSRRHDRAQRGPQRAARTEGGSSIIGVSDRIPAVSGLSDYAAILPAHKIDPTAPLTGGVCARTPAIIPAIMALASQDPAGAPANCSEVTEQKLRAGIAAGGGTFNLDLHGLKLSSLKSGDFDWLNGMQTLNLSENQLTSLPTRLFEGLNGMQTLNLRNNQLTSLPTRLFEGLNGIQTLNLGHNQLTSLPTRLFEELETLQRIHAGEQPTHVAGERHLRLAHRT